MSNRIENVTIIGGGTAGWMAATILNSHLNVAINAPRVEISVIESPNIPTIGVGESTIATLPKNLERLGIDEAEMFRRCNTSFKLGVHFIDWSRTNTGAPINFFHALNYPSLIRGLPPCYHYRKFGPHVLGASFAESMQPNATLIKAGKGPRRIGAANYQANLGYAYHLNAGLFAEFLREVALSRGVKHILDDVVDVHLDESGAVSELQLERRGRYPVEFVIDCSGFKNVVASKVRTEPFVSANDRLLNDRAIPLQIPYRDPTKVEPCTRATALGAGWVWRVPLYNRIGTGYVYSSAFRTDDEARAEFLAHLRQIGDLPPDAPDPDTRVINIRVGFTRQAWNKNCVSIGLSNGFVEPLEATAIFTIEAAIARLAANFPDKQFNPALAQEYNSHATRLMEEVLDYLQTCYLSSNRTDPYWVAAREETKRSDWLQHKFELWAHRFPNPDDTYKNILFDYWSYIFILTPKGFFNKGPYALDQAVTKADWMQFGQELKARTSHLMEVLPNHYDLLTHIRASNAGPVTRAKPIEAILDRVLQR